MEVSVSYDPDKLINMYKRREKILEYNNNCILKTVIQYERLFLENIIKQAYFNENSRNSKQLYKFLNDRMNFMDRYKLVREIAQKNGIKNIGQTKIEYFIEKRNNISHNLSSIFGYNKESKEMNINFGGNYMNWSTYLIELKKWSEISYEIAEYTKKVFQSINKVEKLTICYKYYTFEKNCILVPNDLYPDDLDIEISNSIENKIDSILLKFAIEENEHTEK